MLDSHEKDDKQGVKRVKTEMFYEPAGSQPEVCA